MLLGHSSCIYLSLYLTRLMFRLSLSASYLSRILGLGSASSRFLRTHIHGHSLLSRAPRPCFVPYHTHTRTPRRAAPSRSLHRTRPPVLPRTRAPSAAPVAPAHVSPLGLTRRARRAVSAEAAVVVWAGLGWVWLAGWLVGLGGWLVVDGGASRWVAIVYSGVCRVVWCLVVVGMDGCCALACV
jgi:hypothetical protein